MISDHLVSLLELLGSKGGANDEIGPNGRNKMVINHLEKLFVTSDAATIIRELEVVHPAGKVLVMASQQQEHEVSPLSLLLSTPELMLRSCRWEIERI